MEHNELLLGLVPVVDKGQELIPHKDYEIKQDGKKFYLVKKKKEYPKTYEECCVALEYIPHTDDIIGYKWDILQSLQKLLICRDAYWKIAGDWKPEYPFNTARYVISNAKGFVGKVLTYDVKNYILEFPTEEMRDAFYENFKSEIESCKELL